MLILAKKKDCLYDEKLVQRRFLHATSTSRQNNDIRNDLGHMLQSVNISDEHLLQLVFKAVNIFLAALSATTFSCSNHNFQT